MTDAFDILKNKELNKIYLSFIKKNSIVQYLILKLFMKLDKLGARD
jgi:hypothetical protein